MFVKHTYILNIYVIYMHIFNIYKVFIEIEGERYFFYVVLFKKTESCMDSLNKFFIKHILLSLGQYHTLEATRTWQPL